MAWRGRISWGCWEASGALEEFVHSALMAAAYGEIPFIHSCYAESDESAVAEMLHFYDAMIAAPAMRRASLILGKNWLRLMAGLYPEVKFANLRRTHAHYTVVFGMALKAAGFAQADAQQLYMFQVLRDQMSAAVRLGIVGPMEATRRQLGLYVHCEELLAEVAGRPYCTSDALRATARHCPERTRRSLFAPFPKLTERDCMGHDHDHTHEPFDSPGLFAEREGSDPVPRFF